jgi:hypothetical protein
MIWLFARVLKVCKFLKCYIDILFLKHMFVYDVSVCMHSLEKEKKNLTEFLTFKDNGSRKRCLLGTLCPC